MQKQELMKVSGFFRLKIGEEKNGRLKIVGDSGWKKNEVTNLGFQNYICAAIGGVSGSKQIGAIVVGTGGVPNVTATALPGETNRTACTPATLASKTLQCTQNIASGDHPGGTPNIANIALIETTASGGTIACGNTFSSSTWNSNQGLSITYQLRFGTA